MYKAKKNKRNIVVEENFVKTNQLTYNAHNIQSNLFNMTSIFEIFFITFLSSKKECVLVAKLFIALEF